VLGNKQNTGSELIAYIQIAIMALIMCLSLPGCGGGSYGTNTGDSVAVRGFVLNENGTRIKGLIRLP